jgi:hypothetical protein
MTDYVAHFTSNDVDVRTFGPWINSLKQQFGTEIAFCQAVLISTAIIRQALKAENLIPEYYGNGINPTQSGIINIPEYTSTGKKIFRYAFSIEKQDSTVRNCLERWDIKIKPLSIINDKDKLLIKNLKVKGPIIDKIAIERVPGHCLGIFRDDIRPLDYYCFRSAANKAKITHQTNNLSNSLGANGHISSRN